VSASLAPKDGVGPQGSPEPSSWRRSVMFPQGS
jgi:hypothetical protein